MDTPMLCNRNQKSQFKSRMQRTNIIEIDEIRFQVGKNE